MGRTAYAEERLFAYLKNLSQGNSSTTGLILGQATKTKDYVVLLVRTPEQSDKEDGLISTSPATFQTHKDINETWIVDHAKLISKMLPGGMWVLGVFICSPDDLFSNNFYQTKAKVILQLLNKHLSSEPLLFSNSPSSEKLLLHLNTTDFKYSCKTLDVNNMRSNFQSADWKFQNNYTQWCYISSNFDPIQPSYGGNTSCPVKDQLRKALNDVNGNLDKAMITLNGQISNPNDTLDSIIKKDSSKGAKKNADDLPCLKASIFLSFQKEKASEWKAWVKDCDVELHLLGTLSSHVYMSLKSTAAEAISAVKQDLVRSLAARFEMHWDSLVEEEYGSSEEKLSVHEPPRRVSVLLPDSKIAFNDYLFPGEGASEVISSFKEMLDLNINEANMEKEIELLGDPMEFYGKSSISVSKTSSDEILGTPFPKELLLFVFTIGILFIAIAIALIKQKQNV